MFIFKSIGLYILSFLLVAIIALPTIANIFSSPRVSGSAFSIFTIFKLIPDYLETLFVTILRTFSSDILGVGNQFYALNDYRIFFESPQNYSGLFSLLLLPYLFKGSNKKEKIIISLIFVIVTLFSVNYFFVSLTTGFNKASEFRFSYIISIVFLIGFAYIYTRLKDIKISSKTVIINLIFISIFLISLIFIGKVIFDWKMYKLTYYILFGVIVFLVSLTILLYKINVNKNFFFLLLIVIIFEIIFLSYSGINKRAYITKDIIENNFGYFGSTEKTIKENSLIQNKEEMIRFIKNYQTHNNDSLLQNFNGLNSYLSLRHPFMTKIFDSNNIEYESVNSSRFNNNKIGLASLLSSKYYLSSYSISEFNLKYLGKDKDIFIYENKLYVPFGYVKTNIMNQLQFKYLDDIPKDTVLAKALIVEDNFKSNDLIPFDINKIKIKDLTKQLEYNEPIFQNINLKDGNPKTKLDAISSSDDPMIILPVEENTYNQIRLSFYIEPKSSFKNSRVQIYWKDSKTNFDESYTMVMPLSKSKKQYIFDLDSKNINSIRIDPLSHKGEFILSDLKIEYLNINPDDIQKEYSAFYDLQKNTFKINSFKDDYITGSMDMKENGYLVFQIPYEKNWHITANGKELETQLVDTGLIGVYLEKGSYDMELKYKPKWLKEGIYISLFGLFIFILLIFYSKRSRTIDKQTI